MHDIYYTQTVIQRNFSFLKTNSFSIEVETDVDVEVGRKDAENSEDIPASNSILKYLLLASTNKKL